MNLHEPQTVVPKRSWSKALVHGTAPVRGVVVAGAGTGLVLAGIGGRVVMRIIAVVNDDRDGVMTDARATVGEISFGGTLSLLVFGTIVGVLGGLAYLGLRRWLWVSPSWRGLAFGVVTLLTVGQILFDTANVDFQIFEPVSLVVGLFAALFLINGLILAPLVDRIHPEPAYAVSTPVPRTVAGVIGLSCLFGLVVMVGTVQTMIDESGTCYSAVGGGNGCAALDRDIFP